jgi:NAD+ synthase (glutamine-hydrolysing)
MQRSLSVVLAQVNPMVGDIDGNTGLVLDVAGGHPDADIIAFPELVLVGYPPEDLLLRDSLQPRIEVALHRIEAETSGTSSALLVGHPWCEDGQLYNCVSVFRSGNREVTYRKQHLPNYQVFDEKRYFSEGSQPALFMVKDVPVAITICEDIWFEQPVHQAREAGAGMLVNLNASPFHINKQAEREQLVSERARQGDMPVVYVNQVGGQDELVFDGCSFVVNRQGEPQVRLPGWEETVQEVTLDLPDGHVSGQAGLLGESPDMLPSVYQALVTGVRDYVNKNGFPGVVLGLSGGIDSALTLAIAADALGPDRVEAVMMPFRYTSSMSLEDAEAEARALGVNYRCISIEPMYETFMEALSSEFAGASLDTTEQNIQARCRGVLLMALSNKKGNLVLTTGNKSEMAVGYCTLYGDMAGGFAVIKDVPKQLVYELANYRNQSGLVIPQRVIDRPPSAELAPDQKDEDALPPYEILDQILALYIEEDQSAEAIIARGFESETVYRIVRLVDINEYKRRQAPVGVRLTRRGFGRDRRYPITNGWKVGN